MFLTMPWTSTLILALSTLDLAKVTGQRLDKPVLLSGFNGLDDALKNNLPITPHDKVELWTPGWILEDCKTLTENEKFSPHDIETFNVHYADCSAPWILCRHKDSPDPLWHFIELFGRIPVRARAHVKGMLMLPNNQSNYGYNANDYIALFNQQREGHHDWSSLTVMMHEVGHSLDRTAYRDSQLSTSDQWRKAVEQDSKIPDAYAGTNFQEDVAQSTVIAAYDLVVPGGLGNMKEDWGSIQHQYELIKKEQAEALTTNLLVPGGRCVYRVANSQAVQISSKKRKTRRAMRGVTVLTGKPNTDLGEDLQVIQPSGLSSENSCPRPEGA